MSMSLLCGTGHKPHGTISPSSVATVTIMEGDDANTTIVIRGDDVFGRLRKEPALCGCYTEYIRSGFL